MIITSEIYSRNNKKVTYDDKYCKRIEKGINKVEV